MKRDELILKVLKTAEVEIGTSESPKNSNNVKYNTWFYGKIVYDGDKPGAKYPWCGTFVSWVFFIAGASLGVIDYTRGFAGCPFAVKNVAKWGVLVTKPQAGDVCFFDWNGDGKFDHTAIYVKHTGEGTFQTIEGNTSHTDASNGGEVMRMERKYKNAIFVRPNAILNVAA